MRPCVKRPALEPQSKYVQHSLCVVRFSSLIATWKTAPDCAGNSSYRLSFPASGGIGRVDYCIPPKTPSITQLRRLLSMSESKKTKLDRTYPLCGYKITLLTLGP